MSHDRKNRFFDQHETARVEALTGVPLATFGQRLAAYPIDTVVVKDQRGDDSLARG